MTADGSILINEHGAVSLYNELGDLICYGEFDISDHVRKKLSENAGEWQGHIVGAYMTNNGIGYAVRSEREKKSVQIYPETALEFVPDALAELTRIAQEGGDYDR